MVTLPRPTSRTVHRLAVATLVANVLIVATGGLVRLTGSGLGCPTWPDCASGSLLPTRELGWHSYVEFGNRALTDVVAAVTAVTLFAAYVTTPARRDARTGALLVFLGIPAQAVLGGVTVRTHLDPWVVSLHFVLSMAIVAAATWLVQTTRDGDGMDIDPAQPVHPLLRRLAVVTAVVTAAVVYLGTIVTGSGPHAGAPDVQRIGIDPRTVAQLHADGVMLLIGLSVALAVAVRATGASSAVRKATAVTVGVELAQGAIGYVQYFTHLPIALVDLHLLGATVLVVALTRMLLATGRRRPGEATGRDGGDRGSRQGAAARTRVPADEVPLPR
jgi:cytochrome c oxidase assembly protein subunit 15